MGHLADGHWRRPIDGRRAQASYHISSWTPE